MNILMLGRWLPPPRHLVRATREFQFARRLARKHRLTLAFITDSHDAAGALGTLRGEFGDLEFAIVPRGWKSLASAVRLAAGDSCTLSYFRSEALRTRLRERLRTTVYDVIFVSSSSMIQYALEADPSIPLVVDFGEVDSEWWLRQAERGSFPSTRFFRTEAMRLRAAERAAARRAALLVVASPEAADVVGSFAGKVSTSIVPNGLDVESFGPRGQQPPTILANIPRATAADIREALEFYRTVMTIVRGRVPGVRLLISAAESGGRVSGVPGVEIVTGMAEAGWLLRHATVAMAPLQTAEGIWTAVLEPMAAGLPVVASSAVLRGLAVDAGHELLVSDDPVDFALKVIRLLEDEALRGQLGERGRSFVAARYSWGKTAAKLDEMIEGLDRGRRPTRPADGGPLARAHP